MICLISEKFDCFFVLRCSWSWTCRGFEITKRPVMHEISYVITFIENYRLIAFDVIAIRWKLLISWALGSVERADFIAGACFHPKLQRYYIALIVYRWSILTWLNIESRCFKRNRFYPKLQYRIFKLCQIIVTRPSLVAQSVQVLLVDRLYTFDVSTPVLSTLCVIALQFRTYKFLWM